MPCKAISNTIALLSQECLLCLQCNAALSARSQHLHAAHHCNCVGYRNALPGQNAVRDCQLQCHKCCPRSVKCSIVYTIYKASNTIYQIKYVYNPYSCCPRSLALMLLTSSRMIWGFASSQSLVSFCPFFQHLSEARYLSWALTALTCLDHCPCSCFQAHICRAAPTVCYAAKSG